VQNLPLNMQDSVTCTSKDLTIDFSGSNGVASLSFYDSARFEIDVEGQGSVNIGCSVMSLTDIQFLYPQASMSF
jgi:hypothetical protein